MADEQEDNEVNEPIPDGPDSGPVETKVNDQNVFSFLDSEIERLESQEEPEKANPPEEGVSAEDEENKPPAFPVAGVRLDNIDNTPTFEPPPVLETEDTGYNPESIPEPGDAIPGHFAAVTEETPESPPEPDTTLRGHLERLESEPAYREAFAPAEPSDDSGGFGSEFQQDQTFDSGGPERVQGAEIEASQVSAQRDFMASDVAFKTSVTQTLLEHSRAIQLLTAMIERERVV